jgi:hypothetical protein
MLFIYFILLTKKGGIFISLNIKKKGKGIHDFKKKNIYNKKNISYESEKRKKKTFTNHL